MEGMLLQFPGSLQLRRPGVLLKKYLNAYDLFPILASLPILFLIAIDFDSFRYNWGGRGGLLFTLFFVWIEWAEAKGAVKTRFSKKAYIGIASFLAGALAYSMAVSFWGLAEAIVQFGRAIQVPELYNWRWLWDYVIFVVFFVCITILFFGIRGVRRFTATCVYSVGMLLIMLLDVYYPQSSLGIFQAIVPPIMVLVTFLLGVAGIPYEAWGNLLIIQGRHGVLFLGIYWPCAGVHSMLIYLLVIAVVMVKLEAPLIRKFIYILAGAVGTFFVNVIRLFLVCVYGAVISSDIRFFHETIGEVLFLIWFVAYLIVIIMLERRRAVRRSGKPS